MPDQPDTSRKAPELRVYDSRPTHEQMLARLKRDRLRPELLVELLAPYRSINGSTSAVRVFGYPVTDRRYDGRDAAGEPVLKEVPSFIVYQLQRNGTVSNGWGLPRPAHDMLEIGAPVFAPTQQLVDALPAPPVRRTDAQPNGPAAREVMPEDALDSAFDPLTMTRQRG